MTTSPHRGPSESAGPTTETWLIALDSGGPARAEAVGRLRTILVETARFEASRRGRDITDLGHEELDQIVNKSAELALNWVLNSLQKCDSERRFTTWARKFAVVAVSGGFRRRAWQARRLPSEGECWASASKHGDPQELDQLRRVAERRLGDRERRVLILTLGDVPIDVIADRLGMSRGAVYRTLQGARTELSASLVDSTGPS